MQILLVRHGQAGKSDPARHPDDDLRPLTPEGRKTFRQAARGLRAVLADPPSRILASPALRCAATAEILADALGLPGRAVIRVDLLHHRVSPAAALRALSRKRLPARIALVGHEPFLGRLASLLVSGAPGARLPMEKGGACLIEAASLRPGAGELAWMLTRDQLRALSKGR